MPTDFLLTGFLRTLILMQVRAWGQVHGLGIIEALGRLGHRVSPGTVYPLLDRLEELRYLRRTNSALAKRRVSYSITETGELALKRMMTIIDTYGPTQPASAGSHPECSEIVRTSGAVAMTTRVTEATPPPLPPPRRPAVKARPWD